MEPKTVHFFFWTDHSFLSFDIHFNLIWIVAFSFSFLIQILARLIHTNLMYFLLNLFIIFWWITYYFSARACLSLYRLSAPNSPRSNSIRLILSSLHFFFRWYLRFLFIEMLKKSTVKLASAKLSHLFVFEYNRLSTHAIENV